MKILNWKTKEIIFEDKSSRMKETVKNALKQNISLSNSDLRFADLSNSDLRNADLSNAELYNVNLTNTNLENANLNGTWLHGTYLNKAKLRDIDLENLFKSLDKDRYSFSYIKEEILNHPNCSNKLKIIIKSMELLL